ncbi:MAG TPA: ABC transporter permease [Vicinamibacterales bacterium]|jgi:putative ABC transport system permease protein
MRRLRGWLMRIGGAAGLSHRDREIADELEGHLQLAVDDAVARGVAPEQARREALIGVGGVAQTVERYRDQRGLPWLDSLRQDLSYAVRTLIRNPGFAATAIVTIALGIGANSAIFSVVNAVLLRPLPFRGPDRLALIFTTVPPNGQLWDVSSYPDFADWRDQSRTFESMAAFAGRSMTLTIDGEAVLVQGKRVSVNMFDLLGVAPELGRGFRAGEEQPGASNLVVLSHGFWLRNFGGSRDVLGKTVRINNVLHTVIGVMPGEFHVDRGSAEQFYVPLAVDPDRRHQFLRVVGRLKPDVTFAQANGDLSAVAAVLAKTYADAGQSVASAPTEEHESSNKGGGVKVVPMNDGLTRTARFPLLVMLGVVGVVLIVACANVAGLLLARSAARERELAVRVALGAGRGRLVRQLLTESVLIAVCGGLLGLLVADWTARGLRDVLTAQFRVPGAEAAGVDLNVLLFTAAVAIATGIIFGLFPAWASSSPHVNDSLRDGSRSITSRRAPRLRNILVVCETALAFVLLAAAGAMLQTFLGLRATHPGFETRNVLALDLWLPPERFAELSTRVAFYDEALHRIQGLPGVRSAALVADLPLNGGSDGLGFHIVGRSDPAPNSAFSAGFNIASAGYFETLGIPVRVGRGFADTDRANALPVAIVNETAAHQFWQGESPIGHQIRLPERDNHETLLTVVGVCGDVRHSGLGRAPRPEIYVNSMQSTLDWSWLVLAIRTQGDAASFADTAKNTVRQVNPNVPIERIATLDAIVARSIAEPRIYAVLLGSFAALAVILAVIGLYGLIAYGVSQRTHEIGVRVALGAERAAIVRLVVGQGLKLAVIGAAIGVVGAIATARVWLALFEGTHTNSPLTIALVAVPMFVAAVSASYIPARRAASVDPVVALRAD